MRRNEAALPVDLPQIRSKEQRQHQVLIAALLAILRHCFGSLQRLFEPVEDPRDPRRILYPLAELLFVGVLLFLLRLGSRRQIALQLRSERSAAKMAALFGVKAVPHGDTLNATFSRLVVEQLQEVVCSVIEWLIRSKLLYPYRLLQRYFLVAIDGTGTLSFDERHCPHCLTRKCGSKTLYYHPVLEAKLVTANGFAFSLMTEFIENPEEFVQKQDCERKAFARLARRIKRRFPRLPIVVLLDGLYADGPVFGLCEQLGWKYIIVLKDKDLPSVHTEFEALLSLCPENRLSQRIVGPQSSIHQTFRWLNQLHYQDSFQNTHLLNVLECRELKQEKGKTIRTKYKWVTNLHLHRNNLDAVANQGGRLRWKIENEGFNEQKNGGYNLEHVYTNHPVASKIFYLLLQLAHIFFQLFSKASLLQHLLPEGVGSGKNLASRLLEAWRLCPMSRYIRRAWRRWRFQMRFTPPAWQMRWLFDTS